ncbi:unnamed protein product [Jaminaea pallidilutea]
MGRRSSFDENESQHRSSACKHTVDQRSSIVARGLGALSRASIDLSSITVRSSVSPRSHNVASRLSESQRSILPDRLDLQSSLRGLRFSVNTSDANGPVHRRWLGMGSGTMTAADGRVAEAAGLHGNAGLLKALRLHMSIEEAGVSCRTASNEQRSELLQLSNLSVSGLSNWTPFNFSNSPQSSWRSKRAFAGDPNEDLLTLETAIGRIRGDVKFQHMTALTAFYKAYQLEHRETNERLPLDGGKDSSKRSFFDHVPRLAIGLTVDDVVYRIDTVSAMDRTAAKPIGEQSIMLQVPSLRFVAHGNFVETVIRRPEYERHAAWKALKNDQLEWSLRDSSAALGHSKGTADIASKETVDHSVSERGSTLHEAGQSAFPDIDGVGVSSQSTKLCGAKDTQVESPNESEAMTQSHVDPRADSQSARTVKLPSNLARRGTTRTPEGAEVKYKIETHFECASIQVSLICFNDLRGPGQAAADYQQRALLRRHIFAITNLTLGISGHMYGTQDHQTNRTSLALARRETWVRGLVEDLDLELWHPDVFRAIASISQSLHEVTRLFPGQLPSSRPKTGEDDVSKEDEAKPAVIDHIAPNTDVWFSVGGMLAHVGGSDPNCEPQIRRGVAFEGRRIVAEFACHSRNGLASPTAPYCRSDFGHRSALQLPEDVQVTSAAFTGRHGKAAVGKLSLFEIGIFPMLDMEGALGPDIPRPGGVGGSRDTKASSDLPTDSIFADAVWQFQYGHPVFQTETRRRFHQEDRAHNFIFWLPYSATKVVIRPPETLDLTDIKAANEVTVTTEETQLLAFKIQLLHTYCVLVALGSMQRVLRRTRGDSVASPETSGHQATPKHRRKIAYCVDLAISDVHFFVDLPENVKLFVHLRRLNARQSPSQGLKVSWESLMGAVESPRMLSNDLWEEALRLQDWTVQIPPRQNDTQAHITIRGDGMSFRIPFGYVVHSVIDNASVAFKATKQLVHQMLTGMTDSVITPVAEDPKLLPRITLTLRILTIEAQDDPIETRLNLIWRAGGDENSARLQREEAFDTKVGKMTDSQNETSDDMQSAAQAKEANDVVSESQRALTDTIGPDEIGAATAQNEQEIATKAARERLHRYNATSWIRRHANAKAEQGKREDAVLRRIFGRHSGVRQAVELPVKMARPTRAAPLFRSSMTQLKVDLGPPDFPMPDLRDWIHKQGRGTPRDLPYSLLVPFNLDCQLAEWRMELRDYPLPLLHIPPTHQDQVASLPAFRLKGDFCIAEHLSEGQQSIRHVPAIIVPAMAGRADASEYGISVPKVAMPVKLYGDPTVDINSAYPTRITWGQSIQPAIQDVQRVFDGITSPPHDPSPKLGFWDKLPLIIHSRLLLRWKANGGLHFYLKGSRDPYSVMGNGAGWVMCWRKKVEVRIGYENEDREFLQFLASEFVLAIPDLRDYLDKAAVGVTPPSQEDSHSDSESRGLRYQRDPQFSKVCMRLCNGVRWGASLRHEHTCRDGNCPRNPPCSGDLFRRECRFFDRRPHWTIIQRTREYLDGLPMEQRTGDSFYRWRSDFSHLGISINSAKDGLKAYGEHWTQKDASNHLYFSPLAWQHFWAWMRLFDSAMSLPVRQGTLFTNTPPPSPKFGRQLGTIKYRFDIAPLFITHVYSQFSRADWATGVNTLLGIKARLGVFHVDMHQRQQEVVKERPELQEAKRVHHKPFYEAEADFGDLDLRILAGRFKDPSKELLPLDEVDADDDFADLFDEEKIHQDESTSESEWIDVQDFVEVDALLPGKEPPKIRLIPTFTCPRFNFYRRYDSHREHRDKARKSSVLAEKDAEALEQTKFGNESPETHTCLIGKAPPAHLIQGQLASDRLRQLEEELALLGRKAKAGKAREILSEDVRVRMRLIQQYTDMLKDVNTRRTLNLSRQDHDGASAAFREHSVSGQGGDGPAGIPALYHEWDTFDDRFFIHNPTLFFTNETRFGLLRYYSSSKKRKGFIHNMTARAICRIRQLSEKLESTDQTERPGSHHKDTTNSVLGSELLNGLLNDTMQYMVDDAQAPSELDPNKALLDTHVDPSEGISDSFTVRRANVCVLLKPQIVLKSQIDDSSTVIVTAIRTRLQNFSILDPSVSDEDSVNRRVLSRNYFSLDGLQAFHPNARCSFFNSAGSRANSGLVYVPLETLVDLKYETRDFDRIVTRTDASLRYDKFNRLRLNDSTRPLAADLETPNPSTDHLRHHMDLLRVRCPRFAVSANSTHFGAMYNIVTDLILYRAPSWREHSKALEAILLSYDFKDTALLADVVSGLQERIRTALDLDAQYQLHFEDLNEHGRMDLFDLKAHLQELVEELMLVTEAITASEDRKGDDDKDKKSALRMEAHAQDLSWNMMGEGDGELIAKLSIKGPSFTWLNKADNSAANSLSIVDLNAVNVHPDAFFPEIISKWGKAPEHPMAKQGRFVNAIWSELAPVGGISIVDQFELDLHPLRVQMELKMGRVIMEYIFGSKKRREREEMHRKEHLEIASQNAASASWSKRGPLGRLRIQAAREGNGQSDSEVEAASTAPPSPRMGNASLEAPSPSRRSLSRSGSSTFLDSGRPSSELRESHSQQQLREAQKEREKEESEASEQERFSQHAIAKRNAEEMRHRASSNLTFVFFKLPETIFCLSYKGEKDKSITDIYDLVFQAPNIEYRNRTWAYEELVQHMKKDIFRAAWGQRTTIIKSILSHRPKPPEALRNIRDKQSWLRRTSRDTGMSGVGESQWNINVYPPTPHRSREGTPTPSPSLGEGEHTSDLDRASYGARGARQDTSTAVDASPRSSSSNKLARFLHGNSRSLSPSRGKTMSRSESGNSQRGNSSLAQSSRASGVSVTGAATDLERQKRMVPEPRLTQSTESYSDEGTQISRRHLSDQALLAEGGPEPKHKTSLSLLRQRSKERLRDVRSDDHVEEQSEPGVDASEDVKARALFGSSRTT